MPAALDRVFAASAVAVCATRALDAILVARPGSGGGDEGSVSRESFRSDLVHETNRRLDVLAGQGAGLGVRISRVDVAAALPGGAKAAFDRVLFATQKADAAIADARTEATRTATAARQQRLRILADAEAQAAERRAEATSATATMAGLAGHIRGSTGVAQLRALYDARAGVLIGHAREVNAVDPEGGSRLLLPGPGVPR